MRAFWEFRVNFRGQRGIGILWRWFSLKKYKLEDKLSLTQFLILAVFKKLYLVNLCHIFVDSFQNFSESWERNNYLGLIQNFTFARMGNFFLQSYLNSTSFQGLLCYEVSSRSLQNSEILSSQTLSGREINHTSICLRAFSQST